jgi:integral membrane protein (TIGR01906 family)
MRALGAALVALWLLLASFMVVLLPPVTHVLAENTVDTRHSQLSRDYLVRIADDTRAYCVGLPVELPTGEDERVAFTPTVMTHLSDVRAVFVACQWAALAVTLALGGYLYATRRRRRRRAQALFAGAAVVFVVVVCLGAVGLLSFNALFTAVHRVFFAEGTWLFAPDSLLICALPEPFWMGCALVWASSLLLLCAIVSMVACRQGSARRSPKESAIAPPQ